MLIKKAARDVRRGTLLSAVEGVSGSMDRRAFLRRSGLTAESLVAIGALSVFWFALSGGVAVAISGYLLLFPFYVTNILGMQLAQIVHSVIAMLLIAVILGYGYIGTVGMEGAFEAMRTGKADLNWAEEHHGLWLEDEVAKGRVSNPHPLGSATPAE